MNLTFPLQKYVEQGKSFEEAAQIGKDLGFSSASLSLFEGTESLKPYAENLRNLGFMYEIHGNLCDVNPSSTNEGIRLESLRQLRDEIMFAKEIGCRLLTIHPGRMRNFTFEEKAYSKLSESLEEVVPFAITNNVTLCIENMEDDSKYLCRTMDNVRFLLGKFPVGFTLDPVHCVMNRIDPVEMYREFRSRIKVIHLSGVSSRRSHVEIPLSESEYDFTDFIKEIENFEGPVRIENRALEKFEESLKFIHNIIKN